MGEKYMKRNLFSRCSWHAVFVVGVCTFLAKGAVPPPQTSSENVSSKTISASTIQIEPVESSDSALLPDFRVAIYENLVEEVTRTSGFEHVYRSGDHRADVQDLLILRTRVESFKRGSEKKREVTTVAGATIIKTDVQLVTRDGRTLMDRQVEGKVRLFGGNLNATRDLAKRVARLIRQTADRHALGTPGT
jgi:hypothetical protein